MGLAPCSVPASGRSPKALRLRLRRQRAAGLGDDRLERLALVHRDVGQDLAVEVDAGELQAVHEAAIGQALHPHRRVDPLDPQGAERPLLHLAVAIGILPGLLDRLAGDPDRVLAAAVIARRLLQDPLVLGARGYAALDACHILYPLISGRKAPR